MSRFSILLACAIAGCGAKTPAVATAPAKPPAMPGPYRNRLEAAVLLNARCVSCHSAEASEWSDSLHHRAHDNAPFQAAFALEPTSFCRGCHAPEGIAELGVGCVSCHVTDGKVLTRADLGATGGCANCHEFGFPAARSNDDASFMQTTVREHARSSAAANPCAGCHMPLVNGRRSHAFAEVRSPGWLKDHLQTKAEIRDGHARITLAQTTPGHAFPTGDLFRRLEVGYELRDATGKVTQREVRHLGRRFEHVPGESARRLLEDNRVFDDPKIIDLPINGPAGSLEWWVTYQRVAQIGSGVDEANATIESEVRLSGGMLPWEAKR